MQESETRDGPETLGLLNVAQAAKLLGCCPSTLYARVLAGDIACIKLWKGRRNRSIRFTEEGLRKHVADSVVPVKSGA